MTRQHAAVRLVSTRERIEARGDTCGNTLDPNESREFLEDIANMNGFDVENQLMGEANEGT